MRSMGLFLLLLLLPGLVLADPGIPALTLSTGEDGSQSYSLTLQILALMTVLTLLPAALLMMTSFTRIIIVLAILRQAMGVQSTPSNQIMIGLALFLTFFIMSPVFSTAYENLVVASVLMAMGMMMLSPMLISLPFKLMLFVLIDGWALLMGTLASSFYI